MVRFADLGVDAAVYAADASTLHAWDAAMVDDVQRHSAENINFTTMANGT